jgi:hypothetical protein
MTDTAAQRAIFSHGTDLGVTGKTVWLQTACWPGVRQRIALAGPLTTWPPPGSAGPYTRTDANSLETLAVRVETDFVDLDMDGPIDQTMTQLVSGVGQVCISASMLEWALTYLTGLIENWDDAKHRDVFGRPRQPLKEYRKLVPRLVLQP